MKSTASVPPRHGSRNGASLEKSLSERGGRRHRPPLIGALLLSGVLPAAPSGADEPTSSLLHEGRRGTPVYVGRRRRVAVYRHGPAVDLGHRLLHRRPAFTDFHSFSKEVGAARATHLAPGRRGEDAARPAVVAAQQVIRKLAQRGAHTRDRIRAFSSAAAPTAAARQGDRCGSDRRHRSWCTSSSCHA